MSNFNIMLFSVETKKFSLKRNFEKERKEREAAEKACIDALAQMEGFNRSEPTSEGKIQVLNFLFCFYQMPFNKRISDAVIDMQLKKIILYIYIQSVFPLMFELEICDVQFPVNTPS